MLAFSYILANVMLSRAEHEKSFITSRPVRLLALLHLLASDPGFPLPGIILSDKIFFSLNNILLFI